MTTIYLAIASPFSGIIPDFGIFGADFNTWWKKLFAGLLAAALIYCGVHLVAAFATYHRAQQSGIAGQTDAAKGKMAHSGIALGLVAMFSALSVAFFSAVS